MCARLEFGDVHALLRTDDLVAECQRRRFHGRKLLALLLRGFLGLVGFLLFLRDFAVGLRFPSTRLAD